MEDTRYLYNKGYFRKANKFISNPKRLERLADKIMSYNPKTVLDIGCGVGQLVEKLRERGVDARGTDFADALKLYWKDKPYFQVADAKRQPFADKEFDLVISTDVLEHIYEEDLPEVVAEMKRVGRVVLAFPAEGKPQSRRQALFHVTNQPMSWWHAHLPGIEVFNSRDYQ
jgi:2-polyprenyl-3-methyl-5-hydroxy-6-metoxy-1,4-benzoquinol methylase